MASRVQKEQKEQADFAINVKWSPKIDVVTDPALDSSVGQVGITVRDTPVTAYKRDRGDVGTDLTIPLYDVVEWIASNWWSLLYEPLKSDSPEDDPGFVERHWMGTARHGFALPDLWFIPEGDKVCLSAASAYLPYARLTFTEEIDASVSVETVRDTLTTFVDEVLTHLSKQGVGATDAHDEWALVRSTTVDQEGYCRLIGSLGLSPYDEHQGIDELLDLLSDKLKDERLLADLFQASDVSNLKDASEVAKRFFETLPTAKEVSLAALSGIEVPEDYRFHAWRRGVDAATDVRTAFGIAKFDPKGGEAFFETLGLDPSEAPAVDADNAVAGQVSAAFARNHEAMRLVLAGDSDPHRRFAAARAAFLAWCTGADSARLITRAKTRDQQASRAFAAEMLAPIGYIKRRVGANTISTYRIDEIAAELNVSPQVVYYQAQNNQIGIWQP